MKRPVTGQLWGLAAAVLLGVGAAPGQTYSHARVVRLSFVEGSVTLQRPDVEEWAEAPMNTPIQEGFKLSTAEGAFAEVEFENGSTLRMGQLTGVEFTQLGLKAEGAKVNRLTMDNGYATFSFVPEGQDVYEVMTPQATLTPTAAAMFRVDVDSSEERVEVFRGALEVQSSLGSWTLAKNSVLDLMPNAEQPALLSEGIAPDDWDRWVQQRQTEVEAAANRAPPGAPAIDSEDTSYGWSDLAEAGNWAYLSSFGYGWIPNVRPGWYPYSSGRWCWYPIFGWVWISADPWGWLPYHFGGWDYIPGIGWMWFPGGFGPWSPGLVTWYGGPGWIGWVPRSGRPNGVKTNPCPSGQTCGIAMPTGAFQNGRPVGPGTILALNPLASGKMLEKPGIAPTHQAFLPGQVANQPSAAARTGVIVIGLGGSASSPQTPGAPPAPSATTASNRGGRGSALASPARHAAPGTNAEITYDPEAGRYVNTSRLPGRAEPASGRPPYPASAAASQGQSEGGFHHAAPGSVFSSASTPRSAGATASSGASLGGATAGGTKSGSGATAGGIKSESGAGSAGSGGETHSGAAAGGHSGGGLAGAPHR